ncbi:hypothetical protein M514_00257 [Trichuris suis]|uniref:Uncharacterized protein n=1 Tax=Trichuris suis TaxID=68888 RepID=A0A085NEG1_9BILA|nr:hypothetical protein M513_00257 [Trichuris suis]KFD67857.1 hypothetical protein M514_00257 [Trichuris suis]
MEKAVRQRIREGHATWSVLTVRGPWLDPGRFYCSTQTWLPVSVRAHGYASGPLFRRNTAGSASVTTTEHLRSCGTIEPTAM